MSRDRHVDFLGQEIKVGSYLTYSALWGRSPILKFALVTRLETRDNEYDWGSSKRITAATLRVLSVDRTTVDPKTYKSFDGYKWVLQKDGKEITLGFVDRVVVVQDEKVPDEVRAILEEAYEARKKKQR